MTCYEDTKDDKNGNGDGENNQESKNPEARSEKINQKLDVSNVESWVIMQVSARMVENQVGMAIMRPLP